MASPLRETWDGLLDLVYPPKCLVCGDIGEEVLCPECRADFAPMEPPLCGRCGDMIAARPTGLCRDCEETPRYFRRATAAGRFDRALRRAIHSLKYGGRRRLAEPLGEFLGEHLREQIADWPSIDLAVPIPLHTSRLRARGFNQSALLARAAARTIGVEVAEGALKRVRNTRPQVGLTEAERIRNIRDAFSVPHPDRVRDRVVLVVDDVLTTLHTADECARMLSAAGARAVYVAGVARGL